MKKCLIVIDVQEYFLNKSSDKKGRQTVKKIEQYLRHNYNKYTQVFFTVFKNDQTSSLWTFLQWRDCVKSPDVDVCNELMAYVNKKNLLYKNTYSAAKKMEIIKTLKNSNILEVHLCGFDTDCCVLATAYDLFDLGIKPVVLENLTWSTSKERLHRNAIKILKRNTGFIKKT